MKLSQFRFKLPEERLALEPPHKEFTNDDGTVEKVYRRDECRLMVVHRKRGVIDMFEKDADGNDTDQYLTFRHIVNYFDEGDVIVLNDSKVFPARLFGTKEKTDAKIEVFLLRELNQELRLWDVLVEPARKIRIGNKLFFDDDGPMVAEVIDKPWPNAALPLRLSPRRVQGGTVCLRLCAAATLHHRPSPGT